MRPKVGILVQWRYPYVGQELKRFYILYTTIYPPYIQLYILLGRVPYRHQWRHFATVPEWPIEPVWLFQICLNFGTERESHAGERDTLFTRINGSGGLVASTSLAPSRTLELPGCAAATPCD